MYQKKKYSVLYEYQKLDEELVERETHNDEEQMLPRNPNNTNLSDETNDETVSRKKVYNDDIAMFRGKK